MSGHVAASPHLQAGADVLAGAAAGGGAQGGCAVGQLRQHARPPHAVLHRRGLRHDPLRGSSSGALICIRNAICLQRGSA